MAFLHGFSISWFQFSHFSSFFYVFFQLGLLSSKQIMSVFKFILKSKNNLNKECEKINTKLHAKLHALHAQKNSYSFYAKFIKFAQTKKIVFSSLFFHCKKRAQEEEEENNKKTNIFETMTKSQISGIAKTKIKVKSRWKIGCWFWVVCFSCVDSSF